MSIQFIASTTRYGRSLVFTDHKGRDKLAIEFNSHVVEHAFPDIPNPRPFFHHAVYGTNFREYLWWAFWGRLALIYTPSRDAEAAAAS